MEEPSILDYLKSKLNPRRYGQIDIPADGFDEDGRPEPALTEVVSPPAPEMVEEPYIPAMVESEPQKPSARMDLPWAPFLALLLALAGQAAMEPPARSLVGLVFYAGALGVLALAVLRGQWLLAPLPEPAHRPDPLSAGKNALLLGGPLALAAFIAFGGNRFTPFNVFIWSFSLAAFLSAFWLRSGQGRSWLQRARDFLQRREWKLTVTYWTILTLAVIAAVLFFRFYNLTGVPAEPFSDHAEKLIDVADVLAGETHIFFPRNTGREAVQMYLTAAVARYLGAGLSFMSLKIGTVLAGLGALPFIYLLAKELANRRVALLALLFAGMAYWPNVISRVGLRFPLYPLFAAPFLFFLVRGLRRMDRNDFILAGLFLGAGLHGYSAFRLMPLVAVVVVGIFLLHRQSLETRRQAVWSFLILALMALLIFLPLLRYALEEPGSFFYRTLTRMTGAESPLPGPAWRIFITNLFSSLTMFNWNNGGVWVHSIPFRPALDIVSGALFVIGLALVTIRYVRQRDWRDLFLLVSIPLLVLPSVLSLAFPVENPSLNRSGAAIVPVFILVALALDGLLTGLQNGLKGRWAQLVPIAVAAVLVLTAANQNYTLVFEQYARMFRLNAWNTSEIGRQIAFFDEAVGSRDNVWVVPYPHWVDTRLVGIAAGDPGRDYARWREDLPGTLAIPDTKMFFIKPEDQETVQALQDLYPLGVLSQYASEVPGRDFLMFFVPPSR